MSERSYAQRPFSLPEGATEILVVRHGASQAHVPGEPFETIEGGHADPPLAPEGVEQAARAAARLVSEEPSALFVTTQQRTQQTAAPLAELVGIKPVIVPELREIHLGEWEGGELRVRTAARDPLLTELFNRQRWDVIPGAEDMDRFGERVRAGIETVAREAGPDTRVVAVLHGGVIAELCYQALGGHVHRLSFVFVENCSVSSLIVHADGTTRLRSFNDTAHLR